MKFLKTFEEVTITMCDICGKKNDKSLSIAESIQVQHKYNTLCDKHLNQITRKLKLEKINGNRLD